MNEYSVKPYSAQESPYSTTNKTNWKHMRDIYAYANNAHYRLQIIQTLHDLNRFQHVPTGNFT